MPPIPSTIPCPILILPFLIEPLAAFNDGIVQRCDRYACIENYHGGSLDLRSSAFVREMSRDEIEVVGASLAVEDMEINWST